MTNSDLIRRQYATAGNRAAAEELNAPGVVWDITPGWPLGGVYTGLDSVLGDFLAPLAAQFAALSAVPEEFFETTDGHVIVHGHYHLESKTGQSAEARFVHTWTVSDHRIVRLHQAADSQIAHRLLSTSEEN